METKANRSAGPSAGSCADLGCAGPGGEGEEGGTEEVSVAWCSGVPCVAWSSFSRQ